MKGFAKTLAVSILLTAQAQEAVVIDEQLLEVVAEVRKAAKARDFTALRRLMASDFLYSFGGSRSNTEAIAWYRSHPELLDRLDWVLSANCTLSEYYGDTHYICPKEAADLEVPYIEYRAAFRRSADGTWLFLWFVAGD